MSKKTREWKYIQDAIAREKQLKSWRRSWKINLIEKENPNWENLWTPLGKDQDPETKPTNPQDPESSSG